jgi:RNA polymerase sigma-70 factor (ECF subfamily)
MQDPEAIDQLVRAAQAGDGEAFERLVFELHTSLRSFCAARAMSADAAEEAMQAAFVTAFEKLSTYQPRGTFASWLKGIALNHLRADARRRAAHRDLGAASGDVLWERACASALEAPDDGSAERDIARLRQCLERLPAHARALLDLRYRDDQPLAVVAMHARQSVDKLAKTLFRLRRSLLLCMRGAAG